MHVHESTSGLHHYLWLCDARYKKPKCETVQIACPATVLAPEVFFAIFAMCMIMDLKRAASTLPHSLARHALYRNAQSQQLMTRSMQINAIQLNLLSSFSALPLPAPHMIHCLAVYVEVYGQQDKGTLKNAHAWAPGGQLHQVLLQQLIVVLKVGVVNLRYSCNPQDP